MPLQILDSFEEVALKTGKWLASMGYLGAFGIDALVHESRVLLTEINPRFQGSTALSATLDAELDRPDMLLCHIAAFQGLPSPDSAHLRELAAQQGRISQVVIHNCTQDRLVRKPGGIQEGPVRYVIVPKSNVGIVPNAILAKAYISDSVTTNGLEISETYRSQLENFQEASFQRAGT